MTKPIYEILQNIMDNKKITVAETAKMCNLPDSTVRAIITRKQKSVALEVAFKLSQGLDVPLEVLNGESSDTNLPSKPIDLRSKTKRNGIKSKRCFKAFD